MCYAKLRQVATVAVKAGIGWCFDHPSYRQGVPSVALILQDLRRSCGHLTGIVRLLTQTGLTIGEGANQDISAPRGSAPVRVMSA